MENKENKIEVQRACLKCGELLMINKDNLKNIDFVYDAVTDMKYLSVLYVQCPRCGEINAMQIDNSETRKIKSELFALTLKTIRDRKAGKEVKEKTKRKKDKLMNELMEKRQELEEKLQGAFLRSEKDDNFKINGLTTLKKDDIIRGELNE